VPELKTDLEKLVFRDLTQLHQVIQSALGASPQKLNILRYLKHVRHLFYLLDIVLENGTDRNGDLLRKILESSLLFCVLDRVKLVDQTPLFGQTLNLRNKLAEI